MGVVQYDQDQLRVIQAQERIVVAEARAGAGKTTTAIGFSEARAGKRVLYICLNKANQLEAQRRFPSNVTCRTTHSLAYAAVGKNYGNRVIGAWKAKHVADALGVSLRVASPIHAALTKFFGNTNEQVKASDFEAVKQRYNLSASKIEQMVPMANALWNRMRDPKDEKVMITHDTYLKIWALQKPQLPYDVVILDEAQDTNPVTYEVIAAQQNAQLLIIGDRHQSIYGFRGAINAMEEFGRLPGSAIYQMPRTWRFGDRTAALANILLSTFKGEQVPIIGMGKDEPYKAGAPMAYLSRSNMELFAKAAARKGVGMHWVGGCDSYRLDLVLDAYHLFARENSKIKDHMLKNFSSWNEFAEAVEITQDVEFRILYKIVETYGYKLPDLVQAIRDNEVLDPSKAERILTTAHKSKGLDWDYVKLGDDFTAVEAALNERKEKGRLTAETEQEINLLYVALTRAKSRVFLNEDAKQLVALANQKAQSLQGGQQQAVPVVDMSLTEQAEDLAKTALEIGDAEMLEGFCASFGVSAKVFSKMSESERFQCVMKAQQSLMESVASANHPDQVQQHERAPEGVAKAKKEFDALEM